MSNESLQARLKNGLLQLRWQIARLGMIGKTGLGLLVVSCLFFLVAVLPQDATLQALKEQAETMQAELQSEAGGESIAGSKMSRDQTLQVFYDFFPRIDSSPFWIRELVRVAKQRGVEINSSEYRLIHEKGSRLTRYEMMLPVRGSYSQIRAFIADALQAVPSMAITSIVMKRENIQSARLEARLEINLYLDE